MFHGLRPFPPGVSRVACWDRDLLARLGRHSQESWQEFGVVDVELQALVETAPNVLEDAAEGDGPTAAKMGKRMRARFLKSAPVNSGKETGTGSKLDTRRWL